MDPLTNNRWLWISVATALTAFVIGRMTTHQSHSEVLDNHTQEQEQPQPLPSQSIPLSALKTLVDSPVPSIGSAALALVNKRLGDRRTYQALIASIHHDLDLDDAALGRKARLALNYLEENVSVSYVPASPLSIASTTALAEEITAQLEEHLHRIQPRLQPLSNLRRGRPRPTQADRDRRRRRREAMLFHEGSGELSEGDIIELNAALAEIINAPHE